MTITNPKVARFAVAFALVLGLFPIFVFLLNVALVSWAVWRYPHNNSMAEPWALQVSLFPSLATAIVIAIPVSRRLTRGREKNNAEP